MAAKSLLLRLAAELGVLDICNSCRDTKLLCLLRFIRLLAYGLSTLILVVFLSAIGIPEDRIGLFMTLTLLGDVVISFALTLFADRLGRRKILLAGGALMAFSGVMFASTGSYWALVAASICGVISPGGNEIGPFRAVEESIIAQLNAKETRSAIFAWYGVIGMAGTAVGTIICGWIVQLQRDASQKTPIASYRVMWWLYAALGLAKVLVTLLLSAQCELDHHRVEYAPMEMEQVELMSAEDREPHPNDLQEPRTPKIPPHMVSKRSFWPDISPASRSILLTISVLFAVDSFALGLVPASWIVFYFTRKFGLPEGQLGNLFFVSNLAASISNLLSASISKRIGLIKTMALTHIPSSIFLALIPVPTSPLLAMAFLVLRSSTASMDSAPRQAFLAAAVLPAERTAVMGVVNLVKTLSQSGGPSVTGWLAGIDSFWIAFVAAGGLKISYDLGMLRAFSGFVGPEEVKVSPRQRSGTVEQGNS